MARRVSTRVVINRKALTALRAGYVDAFEKMGQDVIERTDPPDDPATAEKIRGDWGVWADGKKVAGTGTKPRSERVKEGVTLLAGFEFPARLNELGSVHQPPRPFFSPVVNSVIPNAGSYLKPAVRARLGRG